MSAAELARKLDVPTNRITGILNGQRAISGDTALRLAHFFGTSPEFWLNLQSLYELRVAQRKVGKSLRTLPRLKHPERISG
jgi:addiction module HigA family antidote